MTKREAINLCLSWADSCEAYPFDLDINAPEAWAAIQHKGNKKAFALISIHRGQLIINLKCDPLEADLFRQMYKSCTPGYHMNKEHWNTVVPDGDVPLEMLKVMIDKSYELTKPNQRTQKVKTELEIVRQLTGADERSIEVNEVGWTSRVYIIDCGKIVFKFPRNAKYRRECKQEVETLKLLKEQQFYVNVPVLNWVAEDNSYFGFYGIVGQPLREVVETLTEKQKIEVGTQLGEFLKQLHGIKPPSKTKSQTLQEQVREYQGMYRDSRESLKKYFSELELEIIDDFFEVEVPKCMVGSGELVFCHGDLDYNNTLVDSDNRVGVIDFGDARLYDKSQDFRGIDDDIIREAMLKAYGEEVISKSEYEATSKMIDVLNLPHYIQIKDYTGIETCVKRIKTRFSRKCL
ncbi:MAG: phosphotransferase [Firmicutes bacterium]|nr:phosphotransferase [Bacillota bacterium]